MNQDDELCSHFLLWLRLHHNTPPPPPARSQGGWRGGGGWQKFYITTIQQQQKKCLQVREGNKKSSTWFEFTPADGRGLHVKACHGGKWWFAWWPGLESHVVMRPAAENRRVRERETRASAESRTAGSRSLRLSAGLGGESVRKYVWALSQRQEEGSQGCWC